MPEKHESRITELGNKVDFWWKVARAVGGFLVLAVMLFTQYIGPGIKPAFQNFLGVTEIVQRLEFVEQFMPAPRVVEWDTAQSRQLGRCTSTQCLYLLVAHRTDYGEHCGRPTHVDILLKSEDGSPTRIGYKNFSPVELSRTTSSFEVPLDIPTYMQPGVHYWRAMTTYPECRGRGEPIPRPSPWFALTISKPFNSSN